MSPPVDADVIVVGGGPSGLTVASELALSGVDVLVVERRTDLVQSRAGTILPRVLELLDARGLAQTFIDRAYDIMPNPLFTSHMWAGMRPVHWRHLESRHGYRLVLPQNVTEELLAEHAAEVGVRFLRGWTAQDLSQDSDGVSLAISDGNGSLHQMRSDWLVGCDGGRSIVRERSGIAFEGHGATFTGIVADVIIDNPWPEGRRVTGNDRGWLASFPFGDGVTRFNMVHAERKHAEASEPVTVEEVRQCLHDILGVDLYFDELRWASRFSDNSRIADRFSAGRVFLVGESSRIHYPASGVGMNFCIQDGFNLAWKLGAVVNCFASPELLDTYDLERRPIAEELLRSVATQCAMQFNFAPDAMEVKDWFETNILPIPDVNRRLALELNGLTTSYPSNTDDGPLAGQRAPDLEVQLPERTATINELLRGQRMLLLDLAGNPDLRSLTYNDAPVDIVTCALIRPPAALSNATTLLVRPDGYIAWTATEVVQRADAEAHVARWFDRAR